MQKLGDKKLHFHIVVFMLVLLGGCAGQNILVEPRSSANGAEASSERPSSQVELKHYLSGNTLVLKGRYQRNNAPFNVSMFLSPDGSISASSHLGSRVVTDSGRWWISESGLFCRKFKKWVRGLAGCYRVSQNGTNVTLTKISGYGSSKTSGYLVAGNGLVQ